MTYRFRVGKRPFMISIPHLGAVIPPEIAEGMTPDGQSSRDTDWFLDRLYDLPELADASFIASEYSRYVIDLNRPMTDESLYPGQATTGLIPTTCFDGAPIYLGSSPSSIEIERRIAVAWRPYHSRLQSEIARIKNLHGRVVLLEAHSIASIIPRLFDGKLPDFNIGTVHGASCDTELAQRVLGTLGRQKDYSFVHNGRFVGGYITRAYGQPANGVHALQIELSQATYMNEESLSWNSENATRVQKCLGAVIGAMLEWVESAKYD